jgi:hypothetical protein
MSRRNKKHVKPVKPSENNFNYSSWVVNRWRPGMAWVYMAICIFDFIIAPTATSILITFHDSAVPVWKALTLENGGIIHVAFGAILGVAAWGRTREAVQYSQNGGFPYGGESGSYYRETEYVRPTRDKRQPREQQQEPPYNAPPASPTGPVDPSAPTIRPIPEEPVSEEPLPTRQDVRYRPGTDDEGVVQKYKYKGGPNLLDE